MISGEKESWLLDEVKQKRSCVRTGKPVMMVYDYSPTDQLILSLCLGSRILSEGISGVESRELSAGPSIISVISFVVPVSPVDLTGNEGSCGLGERCFTLGRHLRVPGTSVTLMDSLLPLPCAVGARVSP